MDKGIGQAISVLMIMVPKVVWKKNTAIDKIIIKKSHRNV